MARFTTRKDFDYAKRSNPPTISESGVPGFDVTSHFGILGPAGVPKEIVARLNKTFVQALHSRDVKDRMAGFGVEPISSTPQ
ncbi:MAG TPA: tripartite tricarboxylate transporter substrate-binding protein, partial [Burkholderiales bacterium]|nr:tripartite tricarboxylate transporter substrate-binding protein [Burkholderiales bacterium]